MSNNAATKVGSGGGVVTSVAVTVPADESVSGSPVTGSGTIAITRNTQPANEALMGPVSGAAATPAFRALVPADYPVFVASGASHAAGAVPDPGAAAGTTRFLREDATWQVPAGGSTSFANTSRRQTRCVANGNVGILGTSMPGDALIGVGTTFNTNENATATRSPSTSFSASTTATYCGYQGHQNYWTGRNIQGVFGAYLARTTDIRCWIGLFSGVPAVSDSPTATKFAAFRFSTIAGDTKWQCVTCNGTSQTVIATTVTPDTASHRFGIEFQDASSQILFYIDGVLVATATATLPASTVLIATELANWVAASASPLVGASFAMIDSDL